MTVHETKPADEAVLQDVARAAAREALVPIDVARALVAAVDGGSVAQVKVAELLGVSAPAVNQRLKTARGVAPVREGFSGARPLEIAQRYAAGDIDREQMLDELSSWPYPPREPDPDVVEWNVAGFGDDWSDLGTATRRGYITYDDYGVIFDRVEAREAQAST
ncbi:hypothetical protein [Luteipulveratus halotolerans]|uniref:hypothetical protein n=1 Tax=Luteipulveratus halotolerans TaxID=1631356 RepID=UPI000680CA53|nr:hypothetical protein [Luteipulveratus halotolerans]